MNSKCAQLKIVFFYFLLIIPFSSFGDSETELMFVCKTESAIGLVALGTKEPFATTFTDRPTYYVHRLVGDGFKDIKGMAVASFNRDNPLANYLTYLEDSFGGWSSFSPAQRTPQQVQRIAISFIFNIRADNFFVLSISPLSGHVSSDLHTSYSLMSGYCRKP